MHKLAFEIFPIQIRFLSRLHTACKLCMCTGGLSGLSSTQCPKDKFCHDASKILSDVKSFTLQQRKSASFVAIINFLYVSKHFLLFLKNIRVYKTSSFLNDTQEVFYQTQLNQFIQKLIFSEKQLKRSSLIVPSTKIKIMAAYNVNLLHSCQKYSFKIFQSIAPAFRF